jgi:hypothetical protein
MLINLASVSIKCVFNILTNEEIDIFKCVMLISVVVYVYTMNF